jgi:hypothetical protein
VFHYVAVPGERDPDKIGDAFDLLPGQTREITSLMDPNGFGTHVGFSDTGAVLITPISARDVDTSEVLIFMQNPI